MPSIEELTTRFENTCQQVQDSIRIIEAHLGGNQEIHFNINETNYKLDKVDNILETERYVDRVCVIFNECKTMLKRERKRSKL